MSIDIQLPNITAETQAGKMQQVQSYLYQLVEKLNWALNTVNDATAGNTKNVVVSGTAGSSKSEQEVSIDTFNSIKALIIKSADIIQAYENKMQLDFSGVYVAKTDYNTYTSQTKLTIDANSQNITQTMESVDEISGEVNSLKKSQAYIQTGLLDETEGIYGVQVGQTTDDGFVKYARFTPDGVYFYLPGSDQAVAYITNNKLYITNASIKTSLRLGKYQIDTSNGLAFKYVGDE